MMYLFPILITFLKKFLCTILTREQVAGPVMKELMENVLPYLKIEPKYSEKELEMEETKEIIVPKFIEMDIKDAKKILTDEKIDFEVIGQGEKVINQFPQPDEVIKYNGKVMLYTN